MALITKEYKAETTARLFHNDNSDVRYLEGPVGSGKSTMCIIELIKMAMEQQPDDHGVRYSRWAIIRATNPQLRSTTIKTFELWVPPSIAPVVYTAPVSSRMIQRLADGTSVDIEFVFLALDTPDDVDKLTSLELTGAYINETREIEKTHFETLQGRIGRFPQTRKDEDGNTLYGPTHIRIIMDSNAPKTTHWLYDMFHTGKTPEGFRMFQQPPAVYWDEEQECWVLNPDAENQSHLPDGYYHRQLRGASDEYIRVMLAGEPGMSQDGKPVFATYSERKHVAPQILVPIRGISIIVGIDFGLYPAAIFGQLTHKGFRLLDELPMTDASLDEFMAEGVMPLLQTKYAGYNIIGTGDPAGGGRNDIDKRNRFEAMASYGLRAFPAQTNSFITRKETVEWFLKRDEGLLISPHCTIIREAFAGGYIYKEVRGKGGKYMERPDKNDYSHPMDALQYALLYAKYGTASRKSSTSSEPEKRYLYV
jgi:hypothetical protein